MQRAELRTVEAPLPVQVVAVTGGKGGTGKTSIAVNLATALAQMGRRVMLLDGDLGLANCDVLLGLTPRYTLEHVLNGERALAEVILETRSGVRVVPAASGVARMASMSVAEQTGIVQAFGALPGPLHALIVDTAAGIGESVLQFCQAAQQVLVVLRDEPTSFTDTYALIKVLSRDRGVRHFHVVTNLTSEPDARSQRMPRRSSPWHPHCRWPTRRGRNDQDGLRVATAPPTRAPSLRRRPG